MVVKEAMLLVLQIADATCGIYTPESSSYNVHVHAHVIRKDVRSLSRCCYSLYSCFPQKTVLLHLQIASLFQLHSVPCLFKPSGARDIHVYTVEVAGPPCAILHWRGPIRPKQLSAVAFLAPIFEVLCTMYIHNTCTGFLLSVIGEAECILISQPVLVFGCHGQHNWNTLVGYAFIQQGSKMLTLQKFSLPHETGKGRGPALTQYLCMTIGWTEHQLKTTYPLTHACFNWHMHVWSK